VLKKEKNFKNVKNQMLIILTSKFRLFHENYASWSKIKYSF